LKEKSFGIKKDNSTFHPTLLLRKSTNAFLKQPMETRRCEKEMDMFYLYSNK